MTPAEGVVVVTGAAGALGRAVVDRLLLSGHRVVTFDIEDASETRDSSRVLQAVTVDLSDRAEVAEGWGRIGRQWPVVGLIAVAGAFRPGNLADLTPAGVDMMWRSNFSSALWSCQEAAPRMAETGGGAIVTVASKTAVSGSAPIAHATSKAAVVRLTELLAEELRPANIRVNCVLPSVIDTSANRAWMPPDLASRAVSPMAVASVIDFLVSPAAAAVSGARIPVYGDA